MKFRTRAVVATAVVATLVAGGTVAWPHVEPYASAATDSLTDATDSWWEQTEPTESGMREAEPIKKTDVGLLVQIQGPLRPPSAPPALDGSATATDAEAARALAQLIRDLGGADVDLSGLYQPSAAGDQLTALLTLGAVDDAARDAAANRVVVRIAGAVAHASDVLGPQVVSHLVTEFRTKPMGTPAVDKLLQTHTDAVFEYLSFELFGTASLDAVLTLNSDTYGTFGTGPDGELQPVADLTYDNGGWRATVQSGGVEATVWHELGHAVMALAQRIHQVDGSNHWTATPAAMEAHLRSVIGSATYDARAQKVSQYSDANVQEFIAECFAEYLGNDNPSPVAQAVVLQFMTAINQASPEAAEIWLS